MSREGHKMSAPWQGIVKKIDDYRWEIPISYKPGMSVPGLIFTSEAMLSHIWEEHRGFRLARLARRRWGPAAGYP